MTRSADERVHDVRRLLAAARRVYDDRAHFVASLVEATGLSPQGIELGFASLEREATDEELEAVVATAGDARHVHVVLSANVFVAAMRALLLARAAAARVTVRPSPRDPVLARALVQGAGDSAIACLDERDVGRIDADVFHVYGRDDTIAATRSHVRPGAIVLGHGAGLGIAVVTIAADLTTAADALALDVVAFDQRGCLSPRIAIVEGGAERASSFAETLHARLGRLADQVPRGQLHDSERRELVRWCDTLAFAGRLWAGAQHAVAVSPRDAPLAVPPTGRHVLVVDARDMADCRALLAPMAGVVVAVGSDDPSRAARAAPAHARVSPLGLMQRPRLDGPVDRRAEVPRAAPSR